MAAWESSADAEDIFLFPAGDLADLEEDCMLRHGCSNMRLAVLRPVDAADRAEDDDGDVSWHAQYLEASRSLSPPPPPPAGRAHQPIGGERLA